MTPTTKLIHLIDSPFFGGPERQMLGLASSLQERYSSFVLCFRDGETCRPFLDRLAGRGIDGAMMRHTNPKWLGVLAELKDELRRLRADVLICHGYKADVLGWFAARWAGVPVVAVSRGWTSHTLKVRFNEALDRRFLTKMDAVVCVSEGQADKVRRIVGISADRIHVIRNAVDMARFGPPDPVYRQRLRALLPASCNQVVCGVGRLSPEKGFEQLVESARLVLRERPGTGFVLFGDGPQRANLTALVASMQLEDRFVLAGFRSDLDQLLAHVDVLAVPSFTEGLPNVILEAFALGIPVVATAVGGIPEVVEAGVSGYLVPSGDPVRLAERLVQLLSSDETRRVMGARGRDRVRQQFSFDRQSGEYEQIFERLLRMPADAVDVNPSGPEG